MEFEPEGIRFDYNDFADQNVVDAIRAVLDRHLRPRHALTIEQTVQETYDKAYRKVQALSTAIQVARIKAGIVSKDLSITPLDARTDFPATSEEIKIVYVRRNEVEEAVEAWDTDASLLDTGRIDQESLAQLREYVDNPLAN